MSHKLILYDSIECNEEMYEWFRVVVGSNEERLNEFKTMMRRTGNNIFYSLMTLRKNIIDSLKVMPSYNENGMISLCRWCEQVFVQPISVNMGLYILNTMTDLKMTFIDIYGEHLKNPYLRVERVMNRLKNKGTQIDVSNKSDLLIIC